jgi:hypothetical protein
MKNNFGEQLVLVTLNRGSQFVLSKIIRIGDTKYHISVAELGLLTLVLLQWDQTLWL